MSSFPRQSVPVPEEVAMKNAAARMQWMPAETAPTIVVADDEWALGQLAAMILSEQGYRILLARSGNEALSLTEEHFAPVDLLLTDVDMPWMDGPTLWQTLRERHPAARVVFMSGQWHPELDGAPFVSKPFNATQLLNAVRRVLAQTAENGPDRE